MDFHLSSAIGHTLHTFRKVVHFPLLRVPILWPKLFVQAQQAASVMALNKFSAGCHWPAVLHAWIAALKVMTFGVILDLGIAWKNKPREIDEGVCWGKRTPSTLGPTVDRKNPANQLRLVVYPINLYTRCFIHPRWLFGISAINSSREFVLQQTDRFCWKSMTTLVTSNGPPMSVLFLRNP